MRPCRFPCRGWWARRLQSPTCCSACLQGHRVCRPESTPCRSRPCLRRSLATTSCFVDPSCRGPATHQSPICVCRRRPYMASASFERVRITKTRERTGMSLVVRRKTVHHLSTKLVPSLSMTVDVCTLHRPVTSATLFTGCLHQPCTFFRRVPWTCSYDFFFGDTPNYEQSPCCFLLGPSASVVLSLPSQANSVILTPIWPSARLICTHNGLLASLLMLGIRSG